LKFALLKRSKIVQNAFILLSGFKLLKKNITKQFFSKINEKYLF